MEATQWLTRHKEKLGSPYEETFVVEVLSKVRDLDLGAVTPQFPFKDADGNPRFCDFVLEEGQAVRIAMEVDGYDKRGTGTGMSKADFVDWQRRQAALVSQGWRLLRFANTDVRDHAERCQQHISLLLRQEREKSGHQRNLEGTIAKLAARLAAAERQPDHGGEVHRLAKDIRLLKAQLLFAKQVQPLTPDESRSLAELDAAQQHITVLKGENSVMKTTIWAFTTLLAVVIVALMYFVTHDGRQADNRAAHAIATTPVSASPLPANVPATVSPSIGETQAPVPAEYAAAAEAQWANPPENSAEGPWQAPGSSCEKPLIWRNAEAHIGNTIAISGPVMEVAHSKSPTGPTWVTIGARFPDPDRVELVIWPNALPGFESKLRNLQSRMVCARGKVSVYKGLIQIKLTSPSQLVLQ